ncbi:histidine phosphatase family protein [Defluviitalea phaphyphila]|uniref:histidine phosphatase family protein n=1 Tax=Defluviitalea phaphyphila TaxID=1473580 RepID=UPI0007308514|nr:histidine phosphatase family protein [Defluviitalea phaphyphila]
MSTNIYLVRHAEVKYVPDDFVRPLSEKGKKDVKKVTYFFKDKLITKVISSPYIRTIDTIKDIALENNLEIEEIYDCRERKVSDQFIDDFDSFITKQWKDFDFHLEGGESLKQVQERAINVIFDILERYENESIIIGTHGTWLSVVLNYFDKKYDYDFWKTLKMPDIFMLEFDKKEIQRIKHFEI